MPLPSKEALEALRKEGAPLARLAELDAAGLMIAPGESADAFLDRLSSAVDVMDELNAGIAKDGGHELFPGIVLRDTERIPPETLAEAEAETERLYGFKIDWVPGFFLSRGVGPLWGGCAISFPGGAPTVFLIRSAFAKAKRWFIYDREELMAHELCHVARTPLADRPLEEHFAYQTSKSRLRKLIGNCFQTQYDALAFVVPVFILLIAQFVKTFTFLNFPIWPFWLAAFSGPVALFIRNILQRRVVAKAEAALLKAGCSRPGALLFRLSYQETKSLAYAGDIASALAELSRKDCRMAVAFLRFMDKKETCQ